MALPLVISSGSLSLMYVIDRILLTWHSTDALAAALPAGMLHWTLISLALGTANYVNAFVAQYEGAGQPERVGAALWQGIHFSLAAGAVMLLFVPLAVPLFGWLGHDASVQQLEIEYFEVLCYGSAPFLLQAALACFYSGRGRTQVIMWVNLASILVNVVLDYLLIFGIGPLPAWGIQGAGVASLLSSVVAVALYAVAIFRAPEARRYALLRSWRLDRELFGRLLHFGLPNGFHLFVDIVCYTLFVHLVGMMGKEQLTASNLAFNLNSLAFVPMLGFGTAVMTLTGQRIGEGRPELAVQTTWLAFRMAAVYMLLFGVLYVGAPELILWPYRWGSNPAEFAALHDQAVVLLRFVAIYSLFDAMVIVFSSAIRGAGDTRFPLIFSAVAGWGLMVMPTWLVYRHVDEPLLAAWGFCTLFIAVLGLGFLWRFQTGRWKSMSVIDVELSDEETELCDEVALAAVCEPQGTSFGASS